MLDNRWLQFSAKGFQKHGKAGDFMKIRRTVRFLKSENTT